MITHYLPVPGSIPGTKFILSGVEYTLAPLNLDQVQELEDTIKSLGEAKEMKAIAVVACKLVHASLSRNYSDITEAEVRQLLDVSTMRDAIECVLGVSGYKSGE